MLTWLLVLPMLYALYGCCFTVLQRKVIYPSYVTGPPAAQPFVSPVTQQPPVELTRELDDKAGGGRALAWFFAAPSGLVHEETLPTIPVPPTVIHFHGNGELIDFQPHIVEGYHRLGVAVLLVEFRGYGRSGGKPTQAGIVSDAVNFYETLAQQGRLDPERVIVHGRSLGGSVAAQVTQALHDRGTPPQFVVLETATPSIAAMAWRYGLPSALVADPYRTDAVLPGWAHPVLIFQGTRDDLFPPKHGKRLAELAQQPTYVEYDTDHIAFPGDANWDDYWNQIGEQIQQAGLVEP